MMLFRIDAPLIAKKAKPGQFIILRVTEGGERIPLTVADTDPEKGLVTIIFQIVGKTTDQLSRMEAGENIVDFVGPLGVPSALENIEKACVIGGGLGVAIAYPLVKGLHNEGTEVDVITGFRNKDLIILEKEFKKAADGYYLCTDDGSRGYHGFVSDQFRELLKNGKQYDTVFAVGPLLMMKAICDLTDRPRIRTIVSMNSIMLDGTGMCGACRLTVNGETKFACVDGPDFEGHEVDFDEALSRSTFYREEERLSLKRHRCRLTGGVR